MKSKIIVAGMLMFGLTIGACSSTKMADEAKEVVSDVLGDTSENSLDWDGVYLLKVIDQSKPLIQLTLNQDKTYKLVAMGEDYPSKSSYQNGKFEWDVTGRIIILDKPVALYNATRFFVGEDQLLALKGEESKPVSGAIRLEKLELDANLVERYWKLTAINGRKVTKDDYSGKEPHLIFKTEFNQVNGTDGCNGLGGYYEIKQGKISFKSMMSTLMACEDSFVFDHFNKILFKGDLTYTIADEKMVMKSGDDSLEFEVVWL